MIVFNTHYSTYEVNESLQLIRRIAGVNPPCDAQPADGEWREYDYIHLRTGFRGVVHWSGYDGRVANPADCITTSAIKSMVLLNEDGRTVIDEYEFQAVPSDDDPEEPDLYEKGMRGLFGAFLIKEYSL